MKIIYQGKETETSAATVGEFISGKGGASSAVVEYRGEVLDAAALDSTPLEDGAELNVFRIVSGG